MIAIQAFLETIATAQPTPKEIVMISNSKRVIDFEGLIHLIKV